MIKGIYGLNIAVADLDTASAKYEKVLGVPGKFIGAEKFAFPGLKGTNFNVDGFHLNLIASTQPDTSIAKFIEKKGEGVFLVSLEVGDLDQALSEMQAVGLTPLLKESAKGAFGEVNFIHPKEMNGVQLDIKKQANKRKGTKQ